MAAPRELTNIRWNRYTGRYAVMFTEAGQPNSLQATELKANGSREAAKDILRKVFERYRAGASKEEALEYRELLYKECRGPALKRPAAKSVQMEQPAALVPPLALPAAPEPLAPPAAEVPEPLPSGQPASPAMLPLVPPTVEQTSPLLAAPSAVALPSAAQLVLMQLELLSKQVDVRFDAQSTVLTTAMQQLRHEYEGTKQQHEERLTRLEQRLEQLAALFAAPSTAAALAEPGQAPDGLEEKQLSTGGLAQQNEQLRRELHRLRAMVGSKLLPFCAAEAVVVAAGSAQPVLLDVFGRDAGMAPKRQMEAVEVPVALAAGRACKRRKAASLATAAPEACHSSPPPGCSAVAQGARKP